MREVFSDWLDLTYARGEPLGGVRSFLSEFCDGVEWSREDSTQYVFKNGVESGSVRIERSRAVERVSASGAALARIRAIGLLGEYLGLLGEAPHNVTRLDATYDVPVSNPGRAIRSHYRNTREGISFGRKALRTTKLMGVGIDGLDTGTVWHGYGSDAKVTAKVYDKSQQMLDVYGAVVPPSIRYEQTFRREVGVSLRDAFQPAPIFWHHAAPLGLKVPPGVPDWSPGALGCVFPRREAPTAYERALRAIERLPLHDLSRLAAEVGSEGVAVMQRHFAKRLQQVLDSRE